MPNVGKKPLPGRAPLVTAGEWEKVPCALCGQFRENLFFEGRDEFYGLPGNFRVVVCPACDLAYLNPRPQGQTLWNYYPKDYYSFSAPQGLSSVATQPNFFQKTYLASLGYPQGISGNKFGLFLYRLVRREKLGIDQKPVPPYVPNGRLLDVGCGAGFYLSEVRKLGWKVEGIDFSQAACDAARSSYGLEIHCGALENAPFEEASFDVITLFESLEHMPDPQHALKKIARLLKPKGKLLLTVPNRDCLYAQLFKESYYPWELPRHLYHFSRRSLQTLLEKAGLQCLQLETYCEGASIVLLSLGIQTNRRHGRLGLAPDFWNHKTGLLKILSWGLKPFHGLLDSVHRGVHFQVLAQKP